jgi:hypothetical protein
MGSSWSVPRYFEILFCRQIYVTLLRGPLLVRKFTFKRWSFSFSTIHARSTVWWFPANRWSAQMKSGPIAWSSHRDAGFRNDSPIASQITYKTAEIRAYDGNAFIITEKMSRIPNTYWRETGLNRFDMSLFHSEYYPSWILFKTAFRGLDSVSVFRWILLGWAQ